MGFGLRPSSANDETRSVLDDPMPASFEEFSPKRQRLRRKDQARKKRRPFHGKVRQGGWGREQASGLPALVEGSDTTLTRSTTSGRGGLGLVPWPYVLGGRKLARHQYVLGVAGWFSAMLGVEPGDLPGDCSFTASTFYSPSSPGIWTGPKKGNPPPAMAAQIMAEEPAVALLESPRVPLIMLEVRS